MSSINSDKEYSD